MRPDAAIKGLQRRIRKLERHMPHPSSPPGRTDIIAMMGGDRPLMDAFQGLLQLLCEPEPEQAHLPRATAAEVQAAWDRYEARLAALGAGEPSQPDPGVVILETPHDEMEGKNHPDNS